MLGLIIFGGLGVCLIIGVPISVSLGIAAILGFVAMDIPFNALPQKLFTSLDSYSIMAIPFFILAGNLMTKGGISKRLAGFTNTLIGNVRGGMAIAVILACAFFAALSGSAPATVIAIGSMFYSEMVGIGYDKKSTAGLIAVSGGLGPIIPPSIVMVVYATTVMASVKDMFTSGIGVGALLVIVLVIVCLIFARKEQWPKSNEKHTVKYLLKVTWQALPALFLPFIILGGIFSGLMTPTESAGVAVVYAFLVSVLLFKEVGWKDLPKIFYTSAINSAMVMFIVATSVVFGWIFTSAGLSRAITTSILAMNLNPVAYVVLVAAILLIFGFFMEGLATVLLLVPVLWPIAQQLGIHVVHFGMIIVVSNVLGTMTPPVAVNIFACSSVTKLTVEDIAKGEMPFFIAMLLVFMAVVLIPPLSTFLLK
jgi:C4-dicarboxylate transporter DctM subunit